MISTARWCQPNTCTRGRIVSSSTSRLPSPTRLSAGRPQQALPLLPVEPDQGALHLLHHGQQQQGDLGGKCSHASQQRPQLRSSSSMNSSPEQQPINHTYSNFTSAPAPKVSLQLQLLIVWEKFNSSESDPEKGVLELRVSAKRKCARWGRRWQGDPLCHRPAWHPISGFCASATGILFRNPEESTCAIPEIRPIPGLRESESKESSPTHHDHQSWFRTNNSTLNSYILPQNFVTPHIFKTYSFHLIIQFSPRSSNLHLHLLIIGFLDE